jgi:hypothetical protein
VPGSLAKECKHYGQRKCWCTAEGWRREEGWFCRTVPGWRKRGTGKVGDGFLQNEKTRHQSEAVLLSAQHLVARSCLMQPAGTSFIIEMVRFIFSPEGSQLALHQIVQPAVLTTVHTWQSSWEGSSLLFDRSSGEDG